MAYGPTAGGTALGIKGSGFTGVTSVQFGSGAGARLGTNLKVISSTQLLVTTPAHSAGLVDIRVQVGTVNSPLVAADEFRFAPAPIVSSIVPNRYAPLEGGNQVTLTGSGLSSVKITVDGVSVPFYDNTSAQQVSFRVPAHAAGTVPIVVTALGGTVTVTYTYLNRPTITSLTPATGSTAGGTFVQLNGTNLVTAAKVTIDGQSIGSPIFYTQGKPGLGFNMPAHVAGKVNIELTGVGGTSEATEASTYTYVEPAAK